MSSGRRQSFLPTFLGDFVSYVLLIMCTGASAQNSTGFKKQGAVERNSSISHPTVETPSEATLTPLSSSSLKYEELS